MSTNDTFKHGREIVNVERHEIFEIVSLDKIRVREVGVGIAAFFQTTLGDLGCALVTRPHAAQSQRLAAITVYERPKRSHLLDAEMVGVRLVPWSGLERYGVHEDL